MTPSKREEKAVGAIGNVFLKVGWESQASEECSRFISVENALQSWRAAGVEKLGRGAEEDGSL